MSGTAAYTDTTAGFAENPDEVVREVVEIAVAANGAKRGLWRAADLLLVSDRWLRGFRAGEPSTLKVDTYILALKARRILAAERAEQLERELKRMRALIGGHHETEDSAGAGMGGSDRSAHHRCHPGPVRCDHAGAGLGC